LTLLLDPDLLGLHLAPLAWLLNQGFLHGLGLPSCPRKPRRHRPLVQTKGDHAGLQRAPMRQQREPQAHRLRRRAQTIKGGPLSGGEGFAALRAAQALLLARVNTNIALARLASGRALKIGTKYACEVHTHPPGVDCGFAKSMAGPSLLLQIGSPRFSVELPSVALSPPAAASRRSLSVRSASTASRTSTTCSSIAGRSASVRRSPPRNSGPLSVTRRCRWRKRSRGTADG